MAQSWRNRLWLQPKSLALADLGSTPMFKPLKKEKKVPVAYVRDIVIILTLLDSVADPYHFDTDPDPDPGCEKICYNPDPGRTLIRIRIQGKTIRIRIQQKRTYQENL